MPGARAEGPPMISVTVESANRFRCGAAAGVWQAHGVAMRASGVT